MPPRGRKHWCKHCKRSFPSGASLGGHMAVHRNRRKKQPSRTPSIDGERYGLRERCQKTSWLLDSVSSDDDRWALFPKTECQLCFRSFASPDALSMHMRTHKRRRKMAVEHQAAVGDGDDLNVPVPAAPVMRKKRSRRMVLDTVPSPVMEAYGMEEVDAACILVMLSGDHGMCPAFVDCGEGGEMDDVAFDALMTEMGLTSPDHHGPVGDNELMEPEPSSSYEEVKFVSLSKVLKATANYECKICGQVFTSGRALGGHRKRHSFADHGRAPTVTKSEATQPCEELVPPDHRSLVLNLPSPSIWNCNTARPKPEPNQLLVASSLWDERMLGVI
ncbi:zinc finger protein ZAT2-like [Hordeum vulgare subsp. vulgare]|uniref:C2H2-type domain-containing protein n=1 Tax=Hordeum vulgare subsp. vulgare TaxID=112509 RepID=A0A8I6YCD0_HORVV|nr:zinc finger protein ZAT2-like [Hordeum vulgare subsp. vulgare]